MNSSQLEDNIDPADIPEELEKKIVFIPKKGKYFKEFKEAFDKILPKNPHYVYGRNNSISKRNMAIFNKVKESLIPLLQAIMYDNLFGISCYVDKYNNTTYLDMSMDSEIRDFKIHTATVEAAKAMFERILNDKDIINALTITQKGIKEMSTLNLSNFKFSALPKVFKVFERLTRVFINDVGISDLEPLNDAKSIRMIIAIKNNISTIGGLGDLTGLGHLNLGMNPITRIESDFLDNHPDFYNDDDGECDFILSSKKGSSFPIEMQHIINSSQGIISVFSDESRVENLAYAYL